MFPVTDCSYWGRIDTNYYPYTRFLSTYSDDSLTLIMLYICHRLRRQYEHCWWIKRERKWGKGQLIWRKRSSCAQWKEALLTIPWMNWGNSSYLSSCQNKGHVLPLYVQVLRICSLYMFSRFKFFEFSLYMSPKKVI